MYEDGEAGLLLCYNCESPSNLRACLLSAEALALALSVLGWTKTSPLLPVSDICYYKKVCPFNGSTPMIQSNTSDFHFSWNQMPNAIGRL